MNTVLYLCTELYFNVLSNNISKYFQITEVTPQPGVLENFTYFTSDVCLPGYKPKPNDIVKGVAVECSYNQFVWRAIEIAPTSSTLSNYR